MGIAQFPVPQARGLAPASPPDITGLSAINASIFTLPDVPPPPPPGYRPGDFGRAASGHHPVAVVRPVLATQVVKPVVAKSRRRTILGSMSLQTNARGTSEAWRKAMLRMDNELPLYSLCETGAISCPKRFADWRRIVAKLHGLDEMALLQALNADINKLVAYSEDSDTFGREDYWASPLEFLSEGGDCEDFTILKYATLLEFGYDESALRIVVVKDMQRDRGHAVLAVNTLQGEMILDSLNDRVRGDQSFPHYKPVYSINRSSQWLHLAARRVAER